MIAQQAELRSQAMQQGRPEAGASMVHEQVLIVNSERFMVPEVLFHPSDIGAGQAGVCEAAAQALGKSHAVLRPLLSRNVLLIGGVTQCPGFAARFERDLRPLVPEHDDLCVTAPPDPVLAAWQGGSLLGAARYFAEVSVTKAEYDEQGAGRRPFS